MPADFFILYLHRAIVILFKFLLWFYSRAYHNKHEWIGELGTGEHDKHVINESITSIHWFILRGKEVIASFFPSRCLQPFAFWLNFLPIFHACRCLSNSFSMIRTHTEVLVWCSRSQWVYQTPHDFWHQK